MAKKEIDTAAYVDKYSDEGLMSKVKRVGKKMGGKLLYNVYVLYYVLKSRDVPVKVKAEILGALGYVLVPLDLIPDFIPRCRIYRRPGRCRFRCAFSPCPNHPGNPATGREQSPQADRLHQRL